MNRRAAIGTLLCVLAPAGTPWLSGQTPPAGAGPRPVIKAPPVRKPVEVPTGHPGSVYGLAFSPDGRELATTCGRPDPRVRFWDPRTGRLTRTLEAHPGGAWAVAYTPDGTRLVTSGAGGKEDVCVWDARTHRKLLALKGHRHGALVLAISPDGKRLVSIGKYTALDDVAVWDLETGKRQRTHPSLAQGVQRATFLPDGRTLVVTDTQRTRVWDAGAAAGDRVRDLGDVQVPPVGPGRVPDRISAGLAAIAPDGRFVTVRGADGTARLVEVLTGLEAWRVGRRVAALSPDGRTLACRGPGGDIELLDWPSETVVLTLRRHAQQAYNFAFSPDGRRLVSVGPLSEATTVLVWDLSDVVGRPLPKAEARPGDLDRWCRDLAGNDAPAAWRAVWRLAGAPDQALPRLKAIIADRVRTTPADIDRWIADLDHDRFAAREAATVRLTEAGTAAVGRMEAALKVSRSAEQGRRLRAVLAAVREAPVPADRLFAARARMTLEQIGTPEAGALLARWARSDPESGPAAAARAVAARLAKQQEPRP